MNVRGHAESVPKQGVAGTAPRSLLRNLTSQYLDLEMRRLGRFRVRVVERPGLWMSPKALAATVADMQTVVAATLDGESLQYGAVAGEQGRLNDAVLTIIYDRRSRAPIAFNALTILPIVLRGRAEEVLHTGLAMIDPAFRGRGLSWVLYGLTVILIFCHRRLRPLWISSVTQVPSVVGMVAESFENVFPAADPGRKPTRSQVAIARQIMDRHRSAFGVGSDARFDTGRFVIQNAYTGGSDNLKKTFAESPKHRKEEYNRLCHEHLDYDRGDDFLQIGRWTLSSARKYLMRSVPAYSLGAIAMWASYVVLNAAVAPVLHWFTPSAQLGELRPWKS